MSSMDETFYEHEQLLRAVWPANRKPEFWENGRLSSAALKDKKGLSVDRTYDRPISDAVAVMKRRFHGLIVSIAVPTCNAVNAHLVYKPSPVDPYHSEIHGSANDIELSDTQALLLARSATIQYEPNSDFIV